MTKRKRFSETEVLRTVQIMLWARHSDVYILCTRCHKRLFIMSLSQAPSGSSKALIVTDALPVDKIEREHYQELALGGADSPINCMYSHAECHKKITNGTKATTAGSSKHKIAKTKRIAAGGKKSKRPMKSSGKPIPSRPFQKRKK